MIGGLLERAREHLAEPLNRTALAVIVSTLMTSVLGFAFWLVAALVFDAETVGRDNALVSAMMLIATVCLLNLNNLMMRFLPQVREHIGRRVLQAYAVSAGVSFFVGLGFTLVAGGVSEELAFLDDDPLWIIGFAAVCSLWSIWVMQDAALVALGRAEWMVPENAAFSVLKIAALPLMYVLAPDNGVFIAFVVPVLLVLPIINWAIFKRAVPRAVHKQREAGGVVEVMGWRRLFVYAGQDFLGSAIGEVVVVAMPLVAITLLTATETAYFSVPFMLVAAFDMMYYAVTVALTTEAAREPGRVREITELAKRRLTRFQLPVSILLVILAPLVLLPFPEAYGEEGTTVMQWLALASAPRAALLFYQAAARLKGQGLRLMLSQIANTAGVVILAWVLSGDFGVNGIAAGWFITHAVLGLIVLPGLIAFIRNPTVLAKNPMDLTEAAPL